MRKFIMFFILLLPFRADALELLTACPAGYKTIVEPNMIVAESSCPSGYVSVGTADSCLVSSPNGSCLLFAKANTEYEDDSGTFVFTSICEMTE